MGRALLIIATGSLILFGLTQVGLLGQKKSIVENSAVYASDTHAQNIAYTAIQMAMEKINEDSTWQPTESAPWAVTIDEAEVALWYDVLGEGRTGLEADTLMMYSNATFGTETAFIESMYIKQPLHFVPEFKGALSFATSKFNFSAGGNASVIGNEKNGVCADKPAVNVLNNTDYNKVLAPDGIIGSLTYDDNSEHFESTQEKIDIDSNLSYEPVDELIARLAEDAETQYVSGLYKGDLGTAEDPGVFFVEDYARLTGGINEGYGILVMRSNAAMAYDSSGVELAVAGNFTFNGLIIFENAFNFDGYGTPDLNGSVLVGATNDYAGKIDVNLTGDLTINYDCTAENYARLAAARGLSQNRYLRLSSYE